MAKGNKQGRPRTKKIPRLALTEIIKWADNPKDHDIPLLKESIRKFGFVTPVVMNTGKVKQLLAGHGRIAALEEMFSEGEKPPKRITLKKRGRQVDWMVPAIAGPFLDRAEDAEAYGIVDNRLVELGGWDHADLLHAFKELRKEGGEKLLALIGWPKEARFLVEAMAENAKAMLPEKLEKVEGGEDTRPGRFVLIYDNNRQRGEWLKALGLPKTFANVIVMPEDA